LSDRTAAHCPAALCRGGGIAPDSDCHTSEPNGCVGRTWQRTGVTEKIPRGARELLNCAEKGSAECPDFASPRQSAGVYEPSRRSDGKLSGRDPVESGRRTVAL